MAVAGSEAGLWHRDFPVAARWCQGYSQPAAMEHAAAAVPGAFMARSHTKGIATPFPWVCFRLLWGTMVLGHRHRHLSAPFLLHSAAQEPPAHCEIHEVKEGWGGDTLPPPQETLTLLRPTRSDPCSAHTSGTAG